MSHAWSERRRLADRSERSERRGHSRQSSGSATSLVGANGGNDGGGGRVSASPRDTAHYIAGLSSELAGMADSARLPFLSYLLEMAREEAKTHLAREEAPGGERR